MKATQALIDDHRVILKVVAAMRRCADDLESGAQPDAAFLRGAATFMRVFADQCHHAKEEGILFPRLAELGVPVENGPIGVMQGEHEIARAAVSRLLATADACDAGKAPDPKAVAEQLRELSALYEQHIWKEDHVLFPMADRLLTDDIDAEISVLYDKAEEAHGHGVHCEQAEFAAQAEKRFVKT